MSWEKRLRLLKRSGECSELMGGYLVLSADTNVLVFFLINAIHDKTFK